MSESIYRALPFQLKLLRSDKPMIFAGCGIGSGKTDVLGMWVLQRVLETPPDVKGVIAANSYMQLYDSTLDNVLQNWRRWGIDFHPRELPHSNRPIDLSVWNGTHRVKVRCRSLEKWQLLSGQENGWYAEDEAWGAPVEGFAMLEERNRDKRMPGGNRALIITNLDDPSSWIYERFVEKHQAVTQGGGEHWSWTESDRELVIYASTFVNLKNLPADYIDKQKLSMTKAMFERRVLSKWVSLAGGRVYYAFDRTEHITEEAEFDPALPILWAHDFNIGQDKPMSSCLCQIKKAGGKPVLDVFDELILDSTDTNDAVDEFEARKWVDSPKSVVIYGDASGKAKDTRSKTTDYGILRDRGYKEQRVPAANPPIRTRHNIVNARLKNANGEIGMRLHPRVKALAKGFETVRIRKGAQYLEEETREQHVTTAVGYLACVEFPEAKRGTVRDFWF
jgi:Terminase large subunit, T4likevirus-type, N-terminal